MNRTISLDDVLSVFDAAEKAGIHCQSYEENHVLYLRDDEEGRSYFEHTHTPCQIIAGTDELSKEPNKLLLIDLHNHQKLEDFRAAVEPKFQGRIQFVFSSNTYLEVIPAGTSKGNALHFLCNYLNIPVANTVAAGDSENDLSMIREAAIGAAMANSMVPVKEAADYVTMADNDHDGFAEIIKKLPAEIISAGSLPLLLIFHIRDGFLREQIPGHGSHPVPVFSSPSPLPLPQSNPASDQRRLAPAVDLLIGAVGHQQMGLARIRQLDFQDVNGLSLQFVRTAQWGT